MSKSQNPSVVITEKQITLNAPSFAFTLDMADGLQARQFLNRRTGTSLSLAGPELELDIDDAESRIQIGGWFVTSVDRKQADMNQELGYREGFMRPEYDECIPAGDANLNIARTAKHAWKGQPTPVPSNGWFQGSGNNDPEAVRWARTRVVLPRAHRGKPVTLVLGGFGLFDYRYMRVFLNGEEAGTRQGDQRWREPGTFTIAPSSPLYSGLRFGQDNVIALQCADLFGRTERLDRLDHGKTWDLGSGHWPPHFEQYVTIGGTTRTPRFTVLEVKDQSRGTNGECLVRVGDAEGILEASIVYRWNAGDPVLRKFTTVRNVSGKSVRVMEARLGDYRIDAPVTEGEQGFPVHLGEELFLSLAHPSGWAIGRPGRALLRHFPGRRLGADESLDCMEAVYGAAPAQGSRGAFIAHVVARMRRTIRKHDRPYAIIEPFGAMAEPPGVGGWETAEFLDGHIEKIAVGDRSSGCHFDFFSIDFWHDYRGDLVRADPVLFPAGLRPAFDKLKTIGTAPALWYAPSWECWTNGGNPAVRHAWTHDTAYVQASSPYLCFADPTVREMNATAFRQHLRDGVRLLKFDSSDHICRNPAHEHLPGVYSTEAIQDAFIDFLRELDEECPDVFLMLYWGYRSPWWLLHADTLYEPGLYMEASSPSDRPALFARDSVTIGLDQGHQFMEDVPWLGKDSLGVWFSDWGGWNSSIGKARWQEGIVMDLCRGSLLIQPWSDADWLSPSERAEMAGIISLVKARPECFANARPVIGDPWKFEPYGYCCAKGDRAFIAVNNPTLEDAAIPLWLDARWGLADGKRYDIYRLHPDPARLVCDNNGVEVKITLRPNQIMLLEIVPAGDKATPDRLFENRPLQAKFVEPSRKLEMNVSIDRPDQELADDLSPAVGFATAAEAAAGVAVSAGGGPAAALALRTDVPANRNGGTLLLTVELQKPDGRAFMRWNQPSFFSPLMTIKGDARISGEWTVFGPVAQDDALPQGDWLTTVPAELSVAGLKLRPQTATTADGRLDLAPFINGASAGKTAYAYVTVEVATDGATTLGFGADQFMQVYLDGKIIYDTEKTYRLGQAGNGVTPPSACDHPVTVTLTRGRHLMTIRCVSGAKDAVLCAGGTADLIRATGRCLLDGVPTEAQPVLGRQCRPTPWQAWRIPILPLAKPSRLEFSTTLRAPADIVCEQAAYWIPNDA